MAQKPIYEIDGSRFTTLEGFFDEVSRVLVPGAEWGHNLDAFNDILRGGFGTPEGGFVLHWRDSELSRECLSYPETVRQLGLRLKKCHPANREIVEQYLDDARQAKGTTVFDWLVEIVRVHVPGGCEEEDGVELILA